MRLFKSRHLPYRILCKILYNGQIQDIGQNQAQGYLDVGPLAKSLRCSNLRVIEAIKWLSNMGYVSSYYIISNRPSKISVIINLPKVKKFIDETSKSN